VTIWLLGPTYWVFEEGGSAKTRATEPRQSELEVWQGDYIYLCGQLPTDEAIAVETA
jgi:hypothetical protein